MADLGGRTAVEALDAGVPPKEVWAAVWRRAGPAGLRAMTTVPAGADGRARRRPLAAAGTVAGVSHAVDGPVADIAVIGGTGFYSFIEDAEEHAVSTPYGDPSAPVAVGTVAGRRVAFLPRHGAHHEHPPHGINYRANLWALRSLGVRQVLAPCAVGGLRPEVAPGDVVVPDQLVDRTYRRIASYVETGAVHLPFADPYCPRVSGAVVAADPSITQGGTMVVIEGPRFSTRAESRGYAGEGWTLINMTGAPEAALARELRMCYSAIALVTDMDAGAESGAGVGQDEVFALFRAEPGASHRAAERHDRRPARRRTAAPATPGPTASSSPTRSREGPADRVRRLHRGRHRPRAGRRRVTRSSAST